MTEFEKPRQAKNLIARELQKQDSDRINALTWKQTQWERGSEIHRLVLSRSGEKSITRFAEFFRTIEQI
jgi:hypothetical protein